MNTAALLGILCLSVTTGLAADTPPAPLPTPAPTTNAVPSTPPPATTSPALIDLVGEHDAKMKAGNETGKESDLWIKQGPDKQLKTDDLWINGSKLKNEARELTPEEKAAVEYVESMKRAILGDKSDTAPRPESTLSGSRPLREAVRPQSLAPVLGSSLDVNSSRSAVPSAAVSRPPTSRVVEPAWRNAATPAYAPSTPPSSSPWGSPSSSPNNSAGSGAAGSPAGGSSWGSSATPAPAQERPMSTRPFEPATPGRR